MLKLKMESYAKRLNGPVTKVERYSMLGLYLPVGERNYGKTSVMEFLAPPSVSP